MWRLVPETSSGGYGRPAAMRNSPRSRCSGWLRRWLLLGAWGQQKSTSQRIGRGGHSGETPGVAGGAGVRAGSGKVAWRGRIQPLLSQKSCKKFLGTVNTEALRVVLEPVITTQLLYGARGQGCSLFPSFFPSIHPPLTIFFLRIFHRERGSNARVIEVFLLVSQSVGS